MHHGGIGREAVMMHDDAMMNICIEFLLKIKAAEVMETPEMYQ